MRTLNSFGFAALIAPVLSACSGAGGGGTFVTAADALATTGSASAAPVADVALVTAARRPGTTDLIPGQCFDGDGFTIQRNSLNHASFEWISYKAKGTLPSLLNVSLVTAQSDVADEAAYRILTDDDARTMTVDFTAGSWYPRDFGRDPVKYYLTMCASPSAQEGTSFAFVRGTPQLHERGVTADGGNPEGWTYTIKKDPKTALPEIAGATSALSSTIYTTSVLGTFTAVCKEAENVPYCTLSRIPFKTENLVNVGVQIQGASWSAWQPCGTNCVVTNVGWTVLPGQSVTVTVTGMPIAEQWSADFSGMTWSVDRYTVLSKVPVAGSSLLKGKATLGKG